MHAGSDYEILTRAAEWRAAGRPVVLATVVRTFGSSPRPPGSIAALTDGVIAGSVSGGCVEEELLAYLGEQGFALRAPERRVYGETAESAERYRLPCGGTLEVLLEPLPDAAALDGIIAALERRGRVTRRLDLRTGRGDLMTSGSAAGFACDARTMTRTFGPAWRLLLIGAGDVSRVLARMALGLDYDVLACDPRPEYADGWDVPGVQIDRRSPDTVVAALGRDAHAAVVTLTHDPRLDDLALMEALEGDAFYVGALGSQATSERRRARLRALELPASVVARLHAPVGLPVGSRTPGEIAVAILAELTALRHGRVLGALDGATQANSGV